MTIITKHNKLTRYKRDTTQDLQDKKFTATLNLLHTASHNQHKKLTKL